MPIFVCTGNLCRSVAAEAVWRHLTGQPAQSAGTAALPGRPAHPDTISAAADHGLDLSPHRSRLFTSELAGEDDIILGMARRHVYWITAYHPHLAPRIKLFSAWCLGTDDERAPDIPDPYNEELAAHRRCVADIQRFLRLAVDIRRPTPT